MQVLPKGLDGDYMKRVDINKLKSYPNKKFMNFLINYYKEAYEAGYSKAINDYNKAITNTKGVGIKTHKKIINTFNQEVDIDWIQIELPELKD